MDLLPDELAAKILLLLPWKPAVAARLVCRRWRHILDTSVPETLVAGDFFYPVRLCSNPRTDWRVWDSARASWRQMPDLSFIPGTERSCSWAATHRGLVLVLAGADQIVCNPLTRKFRVLPRLALSRPRRVFLRFTDWELQVDSSGLSYTVQAIALDPKDYGASSDERSGFPMLVTYRSTSPGAWSVVHTSGDGGTLRAATFHPEQRFVRLGAFLYVATRAGTGQARYLVQLDIDNRVWSVVCRLGWGFSALISSGDVDGGVRVLSKDKDKSFRIDRLDGASSSLVFESRSGGHPEVSDFATRCGRRHHSSWECAPCGGLVIIRTQGFRTPFRGIVYEISTRLWRPWTGCPCPGGRYSVSISCNEVAGFEFGMRTEP